MNSREATHFRREPDPQSVSLCLQVSQHLLDPQAAVPHPRYPTEISIAEATTIHLLTLPPTLIPQYFQSVRLDLGSSLSANHSVRASVAVP